MSLGSANEEITAASALFDRADELFGQARYGESLVAYGRAVERVGPPIDGGVQREIARAAQQIVGGTTSDELSQGPVVDAGDVEVGQVVARALVRVGMTLERLDRPEAALEAYDEVAARFGDTSHPLTLVRVAWAMYDKALVLSRLGQGEDAIEAFDAVISRFAEATDRRLRPRVSWSLWKKSELLAAAGRRSGALAQYEQLIARHDELIEPELAGIVSWCMLEVAGERRLAGRVDDELIVYEDLLERFGQTTDQYVSSGVAQAFAMKAYALGGIGKREQAAAVYDEMVERFRADSRIEIRDLLADCLWRKGRVLEDCGLVADAAAAFDDALSLLAGSRDAQLLRRRIDILLGKATLLSRADRDTEAIVIFDGVLSAYHDLAEGDRDDRALELAVVALLRKSVSACMIDPVGSAVVLDQLADLLGGDVTDPASVPRRQHSQRPPDREIAARLAQVYNSDCWLEFATSGDDPDSLKAMEDRALTLYHETAQWLDSDAEAWDSPATAAAGVLRQIADGYALLAQKWSGSTREGLSLPSSLLLEFAMRQFGIDHWAAEQGYPLQLRDTSDLAEDLVQSEHDRSGDWDPELPNRFIASLRHYEMLILLCDAPRGREALHSNLLKSFAGVRINEARQVAGWVWQHQEEAAGVASASIFIAQAYFIATHGTLASSRDIFPGRHLLREILRQSDAHVWLEHHNVELPDWLNDPRDD